MGSLFRRTTRYYSDEYELDGALNAFQNRIENCSDDALPYYMGAFLILSIFYNSEEIRDQSVLMAAFENGLKQQRIIKEDC